MPSGAFEHNNRAKRLPQFLATIAGTVRWLKENSHTNNKIIVVAFFPF